MYVNRNMHIPTYIIMYSYYTLCTLYIDHSSSDVQRATPPQELTLQVCVHKHTKVSIIIRTFPHAGFETKSS